MKLRSESFINGEFNGFKGDTTFEFMNGEKWEQAEFKYLNQKRIRPHVKVWENNGEYYLVMDDEEDMLKVRPVC